MRFPSIDTETFALLVCFDYEVEKISKRLTCLYWDMLVSKVDYGGVMYGCVWLASEVFLMWRMNLYADSHESVPIAECG